MAWIILFIIIKWWSNRTLLLFLLKK
jgi:hypothetical protein